MLLTWVRSMVLEFITLNAFFFAYPGQDLAYILACSLSIICGFGMRIILLASNKEITITKNIIALHFFATLFISYVAYQAWMQIFFDVRVFKLFGLQLYLIFCSYLSLFIIQQLNKIGKFSLKEILTQYANKYINDGDKEGKL